MPEFFASNNRVTILTITGLVIFFLPLLILPFFNHPSADDYYCGLHMNRLGLWNYQKFVYSNWGGRFAATFMGSIAATDNFIFNNYYVHTLILLFLNILSIFFLIRNLRIQWKGSLVKNSFIGFLSLILGAVQYSCLAELPTFLFWYSSAIAYHLPIILLQFQLGLLLKIFNSGKESKSIFYHILLAISFFVITGFGELFIVMEAFVLSGIFLSGIHRIRKMVFGLSIILYILSAGILLGSPGLLNRLSLVSPKSPSIGIMSVLYQLMQVYWFVFSSSLFWIFAGVLFITMTFNRSLLSGRNIDAIKRTSVWKVLLAMVIFQVLSVAMAVLALKGGVPPLRYVNVITWVTGFSLLFAVLVMGFRFSAFSLSSYPIGLVSVLLVLGLVFNNYTRKAYRNIIAAPAYVTVMKDREEKLQKASVEGKSIISLPLIPPAYQSMIDKEPLYQYNSIKELVAAPPEFLFIHDDLEHHYTRKQLQAFYSVDSISVKK